MNSFQPDIPLKISKIDKSSTSRSSISMRETIQKSPVRDFL